MKKSISYYLGNVLMVLAMCGIAYIYFPIVRLYLFPPKPQTFSSQVFSIEIPKINAQAPIVENVDPWNEDIYKPALQKGVAQAKGTYLPGEGKTVFLFAHSSDYPWRMNRTNTAFLRLGELTNGDTITVHYQGKEFRYMVTDKKVVWPNQIEFLKDVSKNQLILQTCTPLGTALQRLLVFAKPM